MKSNRITFIFLLIALTGLFLASDFLHTEDGVDFQDDCPICVWQRTTIATSQLYLFAIALVLISLFKFKRNHRKAKSNFIPCYFDIRAPPSFSRA